MQHQEALLKHDHISFSTNRLKSPIALYHICSEPTSQLAHNYFTYSLSRTFVQPRQHLEPRPDYLMKLPLQPHIYNRNGSRTDIAKRRF
jgi:hypothetical protein